MKKILTTIMLLLLFLFSAVITTVTSTSEKTPIEELQLQKLQQRINSSGFHYKVAKNWITGLTPEELSQLTGYRPPKPPVGALPPNVSFRSFRTIDAGAVQRSTLRLTTGMPSAYDAMALGYVTPVKNQHTCGSCWLFAAIADIESDVAIADSTQSDFSEQEAGDCNIWNRFCNGGNSRISTNYLTKKGVGNESCHPYVAHGTACYNCSIIKNVDNWRVITGSSGETQIEKIKAAILNYGPVYSTMYAGDPGFHAYDSGVYEYWGTDEPNHAIQIIGWNDSLSHSKGSGAWLIKNSWGTDWGAHGPYPGCAWVAYGAANIGDYTSAITSCNDGGIQLYYHDEYGWMGYCCGMGTNTAWGAVRFIPAQSGQLRSVDFWAVDDNMQYEIMICDNISESSPYTFSNQLGYQNGTTEEVGYYSVSLSTPITVVKGDDFVVQIKFTTSGYNFPIPIDFIPPGDEYYSDWDAGGSGESYVSTNGETFTKLSIGGSLTDIGIRARVSPEECLGNCYSSTNCTGSIIATNVPCYECINGNGGAAGGKSWHRSSHGHDWCFNDCPACCDGTDNDGDSHIDYPADEGCACCYDYTETEDTAVPCIPELPSFLLLSIGLLLLMFMFMFKGYLYQHLHQYRRDG